MTTNHIFAPISRWLMLGLLSLSLVGCASDFGALIAGKPAQDSTTVSANAEVSQALAPSGVLRVGVYLGSPTSWVKDPKSGESVGIALDLGKELAKRLNVPVQIVEFDRLAQVLDSLKEGKIDFTFTNRCQIPCLAVKFFQVVGAWKTWPSPFPKDVMRVESLFKALQTT
jgi:ABC-type amino acid transport substrate-binding protein